jgi:FixJ family two-component response regulator
VNKPHVLVLDDDQACLDEYVNTLSELGFECQSTTSPTDALVILNADKRISILLTDVRMPGLTGIELVRLQASRARDRQFVVPIFITAYADIDVAVEALRLEAADFLRKPVTRSELGMAMARAQSIVAARNGSTKDRPTDKDAALLRELIAQLRTAKQQAIQPAGTGKENLAKQIQDFISNRQKRSKFFPDEALCDASWNILLDLALAYTQNKSVPVSSACIASEAPISTALRRVRDLCNAGLVLRWPDPDDGRRDLLALSESCFESIEAFFSLHATN